MCAGLEAAGICKLEKWVATETKFDRLAEAKRRAKRLATDGASRGLATPQRGGKPIFFLAGEVSHQVDFLKIPRVGGVYLPWRPQ